MTRPLIVHQLNAVGVLPQEFVEIVAANGCDLVTLFTYIGEGALPKSNTGLTYPTEVTRETKKEVLAALSDTGVAVNGIEFFPLTDEVDLELFRPALALGGELGAERVSTHIFIQDDGLVIDKLGKFCELAAAEGMMVSSEFCPMTYGNPSIQRSAWLADQVGSWRFGIGVDALHATRSGCTSADIAALEQSYFGISQINDAFGRHTSANYIAEVHNREVPGEGDLSLIEIFNAVPAAIPIEIEVPAAHRRKAGVTAVAHVRDVVRGTRAVVASLNPIR